MYSGDCIFSETLPKYGQNADLLIHECTFDCETEKKSVIAKGHSDIEDALLTGKLMNSKYIALTHFSQRYNFSSKDDN